MILPGVFLLKRIITCASKVVGHCNLVTSAILRPCGHPAFVKLYVIVMDRASLDIRWRECGEGFPVPDYGLLINGSDSPQLRRASSLQAFLLV